MTDSVILASIVAASTLAAAGGSATLAHRSAQSAAALNAADTQPVVVIQDYADGLAGIRAANPDVHLRISRDPGLRDEQILVVEYPARTDDPAGRDVRCTAMNQDWSAGRAVAFQIKPDHSERFSLSFQDRNHVAYTTWTELQGGMWQLVQIPFDGMRPNPYFQPPGARTGAPIDVSQVMFVAFAPQEQTAGRLAIGRIVVSH
jgi:carbohydrate binding protein with CBM11 domain